MKDAVLRKAFNEGWIKQSRLDAQLEENKQATKDCKYEASLLDFLQNDFLYDLELHNSKTGANHK